MSLVVTHSTMYVTQKQDHTGGGVLATKVTPVTGGPATFNGLPPSSLLELAQYGDNAGDFSTNSLTAWDADQWVDLGDGRYYTWEGTEWIEAELGTGISLANSEDAEGLFTGGRAPINEPELLSGAFGQTTAWTKAGQHVRIGGKGSGGPMYHWAGATDKWQPGPVPWFIEAIPGAPADITGRAAVPDDLDDLKAQYSNAANFADGDISPWPANAWVITADSEIYTWNGTDWVAAVLAENITMVDGTQELMVMDGYAPQTAADLPNDGDSTDLPYPGFEDLWFWGQFLRLEGFDTLGDEYYWDGTDWQAGTTPGVVIPTPGAPAWTNLGGIVEDKIGAGVVFMGVTSAWDANEFLETGDPAHMWIFWDGDSWEDSIPATKLKVVNDTDEYMADNGRAPMASDELPIAGYTDLEAAWEDGVYVTVGGFETGGPKYYWDGAAWQEGVAPAATP